MGPLVVLVGYRSTPHFVTVFRGRFDLTPGTYRDCARAQSATRRLGEAATAETWERKHFPEDASRPTVNALSGTVGHGLLGPAVELSPISRLAGVC